MTFWRPLFWPWKPKLLAQSHIFIPKCDEGGEGVDRFSASLRKWGGNTNPLIGANTTELKWKILLTYRVPNWRKILRRWLSFDLRRKSYLRLQKLGDYMWQNPNMCQTWCLQWEVSVKSGSEYLWNESQIGGRESPRLEEERNVTFASTIWNRNLFFRLIRVIYVFQIPMMWATQW